MRMVKKLSEEKEILRKVEAGISKVSPLITKTLMEKFEQSAISPVFLVDNKITELKLIDIDANKSKLIDKDELNNAQAELQKFNLSLNDFWFACYDQTKHQKNCLYPLESSVLIISKKTGKSKEYNIFGKHWVVNFSKDLKNNYFQE